MADKKKLSVADILAAARKSDAGEEDSAASEEAPAKAPASGSSAPAQAAKLKPGERPSISDILAMARGDGGSGAKEAAAAPAKEPAKKPAKKPAVGSKPAAKSSAKAAPAERLETASVLAAARSGAKRGPMSKAEAAKMPAAKTPAKAKPKLPAPKMPEKPVYARPQPKMESSPDQGRRYMVLGALFGTSLAAGMTLLGTTMGLWILALARFMFPNILTEPPSTFKVGFPDGFAPGQVETKFKAQFGIWVVSYEFQGQPMIYALSTVCTHLGCTPNWLDAEQKFKCPCHGSGFYKDGINFEGPAPRPLERYAIRVADDGQVEIDKSRKFQEELGQWEDPASFVPV